MNIFQTAMISQVLFGAGARHSIGQTLTNMGAKKALIVTDKFLVLPELWVYKSSGRTVFQ